MARITVEDCLLHEPNRFALVRLASKRAKQLLSGKSALAEAKGNKAVVTALREIAESKVKFRRQGGQAQTNGSTPPTKEGKKTLGSRIQH